MTKYILASLISGVLLSPMLMAMDDPSIAERPLQPSASHTMVIPGMVAVEQEGYALTIIGDDGCAFNEYKLPVRLLENIFARKDGVFYVHGTFYDSENELEKRGIVQIKGGVIGPPTTYGLRCIDEMGFSDDILYVLGRGSDYKKVILQVKEDADPQRVEITFKSIETMRFSPHGTPYVVGKDPQGALTMAQVMADGKVSNPVNLGLDDILRMKFSSDGTLYVLGENEGERVVKRLKDGHVTQILTNGLSDLYDMKVSPQGSLYIQGRYQRDKAAIVWFKGGSNEASEPIIIGPYEDRHMMKVASNETIYVQGRNPHAKEDIIMLVKEGQVSQPLTVGLNLIERMKLSPDGILFLKGLVEKAGQPSEHVIVPVQDEQALPPLTLNLKSIIKMQVTSNGLLYVKGLSQDNKMVIDQVGRDNVTRFPGGNVFLIK